MFRAAYLIIGQVAISEREYSDSDRNVLINSNWHNFWARLRLASFYHLSAAFNNVLYWPNWNLLPKQMAKYVEWNLLNYGRQLKAGKLEIKSALCAEVRKWERVAHLLIPFPFSFSQKRSGSRRLLRFRFDLNSNQLLKAGGKFMRYFRTSTSGSRLRRCLCAHPLQKQKCKICAKNLLLF